MHTPKFDVWPLSIYHLIDAVPGGYDYEVCVRKHVGKSKLIKVVKMIPGGELIKEMSSEWLQIHSVLSKLGLL